MGDTFFDRLVAASGLAPLIAAHSLRRVLVRSGLDPLRFLPTDLPKVMPALELTLRVYLTEQVVQERLALIRQLR